MIKSKSCPPNKKKSRTMSLGKQIIMQAPVGFSRKYVQKRKLNLFFGLKKNKLSKIFNSFEFQCLGVYEEKKKTKTQTCYKEQESAKFDNHNFLNRYNTTTTFF